MNNPFMQALSVVADLLVLNALTLVCSLPVVTAGASFAALHDITGQIVRGEESYLVRPFFRSFAANWKKSTLLGLVFLAAAGLLYFDYLAASALAPMLRLPVAAICFIVLAVAMYAFSLQARYENSLGATLKNAVSLAVGFFPRTLAMVLFATVLWLLSIRYYRFGVPILLMFGFSLPCYVNALLTKGVFDKLES
ncbi:MAG: YesL family protein [Firmicutes bacterium]|nr:YesL family protein [Bacillota bacterium]